MKKIAPRFIIGTILLLLFSGVSLAHTPYLMVSDNEDGTADISGGYSNGQSAAQVLILLKSKKTGEILWQGRLDKYGDLTINKQQEPHIIIFDGGVGHTLEKDGLCVTKEEIEISKPLKEAKKIDDAKSVKSIIGTESVVVSEKAYSVTPLTQIYPLGDDFESIKDILPEPLIIQDTNGVIRVIPIMQGYRYHHGKGLAKIMKKLEAKREKGAKVDFKINDVGLCFGVTTGFLSLKFAAHELYGEEIPKADDFKITTNGRMLGIWDMCSLYFGRQIKNKGTEKFSQKEIIFIAERPSTGEKIAFEYNIKMLPELNKLIQAKKNPEKFKNLDFKSLKRRITENLFFSKDFSYFKISDKS